ncbi:ABC transporter ATP-binding protein [Roseinatronobacter alkalisoli]|uniref:Spermidine/putrescine import ATP-binding protein PotA n=1 Tax=Roseinatronobacter alkalisoli TaxID=3028235 RepID=A0ABT5TFJ2_9RHOB|nr:ABC transporter ATP-binding protein [Roseinatronobacter sp. HJB301]MDD7972932.1 ABC transporter ATP-binding protein [Roseinatronobacter sp. HJB301]
MKPETDFKTPSVAAEGIVKDFGTFTALKRVDLTIDQNEFFTLLGPSGCGKTTLLRLIAGFEAPTEGEIKLMGENIATLPPFKRSINTVFQNYALFPHMTVSENIGFGLKMLGKPRAEIAARVDEMLALVKLQDFAKRRTGQLSGGQQQRVALARALAPSPRVLLLDEPLSALDYKLRKEMQVELKRLQTETGITFIFVTHDQEEALTMSDRIAVMSAGEVLQVGDARAIYDRPANRFVADFIGEANFLEGRVESREGTQHRVALAGGTLAATGDVPVDPGAAVTVMIRPEHVQIVAEKTEGGLPALLERTVFLGTDTHYYLRMQDGAEFIAREQNRSATVTPFAPGANVHIMVDAQSTRLLRD